MVKVELGTIIPKETIRQGQTREARIWTCANVKAQKGYDKITVWATNAEKICGMECDFKIIEITGASISNNKYKAKDGTEKWATNFNINAKFEPCNVNVEPSKEDQMSVTPEGFTMIDSEDIPF